MLRMGDRIKVARLNKGYSKTQLAALLGVTNSMISKFEQNTQVPSVKRVIQLAQTLDISADYLLGVQVSEQNKIYIDMEGVCAEDMNTILNVVKEMKKVVTNR